MRRSASEKMELIDLIAQDGCILIFFAVNCVAKFALEADDGFTCLRSLFA